MDLGYRVMVADVSRERFRWGVLVAGAGFEPATDGL